MKYEASTMSTTPDREGWWWGNSARGNFSPAWRPEEIVLFDGTLHVADREDGFPLPLERFEWGARIPGPDETPVEHAPATWVALEHLREGAVFETRDGIRAVKSEYRYSNANPQPLCVLLASGENAHFTRGAAELVREIDVAEMAGQLAAAAARLSEVERERDAALQLFRDEESTLNAIWAVANERYGDKGMDAESPVTAMRIVLDRAEEVGEERALAASPLDGTAPERARRVTESELLAVNDVLLSATNGARMMQDVDGRKLWAIDAQKIVGAREMLAQLIIATRPPDGTAPKRAPAYGPAEPTMEFCPRCRTAMRAGDTCQFCIEHYNDEPATRPPDGMPGEPRSPLVHADRDGCEAHEHMQPDCVDCCPQLQSAAPPTVPGEPPPGWLLNESRRLCWCGRVTTIRVPVYTPFCEEHAHLAAPPTPQRAPVDEAAVRADEPNWGALLDIAAPDPDDEYGWRWVCDDAGFWYADALLDGFTICCVAEIETWDDGEERVGGVHERAKWPRIAALVDFRNAMRPRTSAPTPEGADPK